MDTLKKHPIPFFIWAVLLLVSDLPNILLVNLSGADPGWLPWAKIGLLAAFLILCWLWEPIRAAWKFGFVFLIFLLANWSVDWIIRSDFWRSAFYQEPPSYTATYLSFQVLDVLRALLVIAALWWLLRDRKAFFLDKGQLDAPIEPVRWLGIGQGESWRVFGWIFTAGAGAAIVIPLAFSVPLTAEAFSRALPLLPVAILLAALNAFAEEAYYRAPILATLVGVVGKTQALLMACVFFGLSHYLYGSPPGVLGFALTAFLAFLLGKSMLETRGMGWAWFIHFVPDVFVFFSYALTWN
ncbi:MAG: CPBP family intramembrane metalloprotease [Anaerolineae bacterium]|nr:CPBP family intramembrane metalloprotease [Anaerolineae bacterium]